MINLHRLILKEFISILIIKKLLTNKVILLIKDLLVKIYSHFKI